MVINWGLYIHENCSVGNHTGQWGSWTRYQLKKYHKLKILTWNIHGLSDKLTKEPNGRYTIVAMVANLLVYTSWKKKSISNYTTQLLDISHWPMHWVSYFPISCQSVISMNMTTWHKVWTAHNYFSNTDTLVTVHLWTLLKLESKLNSGPHRQSTSSKKRQLRTIMDYTKKADNSRVWLLN